MELMVLYRKFNLTIDYTFDPEKYTLTEEVSENPEMMYFVSDKPAPHGPRKAKPLNDKTFSPGKYTVNREPSKNQTTMYVGYSKKQLNMFLKIYGIEWDLKRPGSDYIYSNNQGHAFLIQVIDKNGNMTTLT